MVSLGCELHFWEGEIMEREAIIVVCVTFFIVCHFCKLSRLEAIEKFLATKYAKLWGDELTVGMVWEFLELGGYTNEN
jgi:hypothetical protein